MTRETTRADVLAGLVGALVVLPQGVAYATLAGMPPQYGLYCAMLPAIVGALWGSSRHLISGPTNAISLVVFATVAPMATPESPRYVELVLTLALLVGLLQLAMGVARLGALVNFISHTVVVGFTAGAGLLIIAAQLQHFFGVPVPPGMGFFETLNAFARGLARVDPWLTATAAVTLVASLVARRTMPRVPYMIVGMLAGGLFGYALLATGTARVPVVGALPSGLPALSLPSSDPETWRRLFPAALALTVLGLTEAVSIGRAIAIKSGQRIDGNQEFIGQGLSNIAGAFTSSYPSSGSFNRSGINYEAGARTPFAAVYSAVFLVLVLLAVAPLAAYLPLAAMAAMLFIVGWSLIDFAEIRRILRTSRGDALVLAVTFVSTITIQLEFAIFVGVLASLLVYLQRTTHPRLTPVVPDASSPQRRFVPVASAGAASVAGPAAAPNTECPQLALYRVDGSLFFGAVEHVRDELHDARTSMPQRRHMLLIGSGINFIDVAGAELLVREARLAEETEGTLYVCNLKPAVRDLLERGGFVDAFGRDRIYETKDDAIRAIYTRLDSAGCERCEARIFTECRSALPDGRMRTA